MKNAMAVLCPQTYTSFPAGGNAKKSDEDEDDSLEQSKEKAKRRVLTTRSCTVCATSWAVAMVPALYPTRRHHPTAREREREREERPQ